MAELAGWWVASQVGERYELTPGLKAAIAGMAAHAAQTRMELLRTIAELRCRVKLLEDLHGAN
jgi:hypothetical protein